MKSENHERRLTTIVATDVVGFSRLMGVDEGGTLSDLKAHREELFEPKTRQYGGRTVKLMGDGTLMEFASVVDAVLFAVEVQCAMREHNADVPADRQIVYRIGINIGDIIVEGDDIYGDGVNIAARLEGLSEPGGICVSSNVFNQVKNKVEVGFEDLGDQQVKNIEEPVRVYKVTTGPCERLKGDLAIVAGATACATDAAEKPAIAVLPFDNMSGDAEQEYFADGITEDIITELARFQNLVVIARNSTFSYKGKAPRVKDVARDLGVHYVVEGSVRKAGNRVRVTVQLIESKSEKHVWAERYDRDLTDIFEIQDEVTKAIIGALPSRLEAADIERIKRKPPQDLAAYDYVLRSKILHHHGTRRRTPRPCRSSTRPSKSTRSMPRLTPGRPAPCGRPFCAVMRRSRTHSTRSESRMRKRLWRSTRTTWSASESCARSIWNKKTWTRRSIITTVPSP